MTSGSSMENTPSKPAYRSASPDADTGSGDQQPLRVFADILDQILSTSDDQSNPVVDPCQKDLLAVAARYSTLAFCVDPVLLELIRVVTRQIKGLPVSRMQAMERAVAASLVDDQVSHGRLQNLWEQLKKRDSNG